MKIVNQNKFNKNNLLTLVQFQIAIKTALVAILGWTIGNWFSHITERPDKLISGLWCALTAIVVLQTHLGGTYKTSWIRFLGVILGSIIGALSTSLLGSNPLTLGVSIFFIVMLCFILNIKESIRISCLSVTVVMVLWGLQPTISPWTFAFFRSIDSILGILIAVFVAHIIWPFQAKEKLKINMSYILDLIRDLFKLSFYTESSLPTEEEYNQIKLNLDDLIQDNILKLEEAKIELWSDQKQFKKYQFLHGRLQHMRKLIITLSKVYEYAKKIVDEELMKQLRLVLNLLDQGLYQLSQTLLDNPQTLNLSELAENQKKLTEELLRFRSKKVTGKFDLSEVEGFYVFFYNLDIFIKTFFKIVETSKNSD